MAQLVKDIRIDQFNAGAYQYDARERKIWIACPCGCGWIVGEELKRFKYPRDSARITLLHNLSMTNGDGSLHWRGSLINGEWTEI